MDQILSLDAYIERLVSEQKERRKSLDQWAMERDKNKNK